MNARPQCGARTEAGIGFLCESCTQNRLLRSSTYGEVCFDCQKAPPEVTCSGRCRACHKLRVAQFLTMNSVYGKFAVAGKPFVPNGGEIETVKVQASSLYGGQPNLCSDCKVKRSTLAGETREPTDLGRIADEALLAHEKRKTEWRNKVLSEKSKILYEDGDSVVYTDTEKENAMADRKISDLPSTPMFEGGTEPSYASYARRAEARKIVTEHLPRILEALLGPNKPDKEALKEQEKRDMPMLHAPRAYDFPFTVFSTDPRVIAYAREKYELSGPLDLSAYQHLSKEALREAECNLRRARLTEAVTKLYHLGKEGHVPEAMWYEEAQILAELAKVAAAFGRGAHPYARRGAPGQGGPHASWVPRHTHRGVRHSQDRDPAPGSRARTPAGHPGRDRLEGSGRRHQGRQQLDVLELVPGPWRLLQGIGFPHAPRHGHSAGLPDRLAPRDEPHGRADRVQSGASLPAPEGSAAQLRRPSEHVSGRPRALSRARPEPAMSVWFLVLGIYLILVTLFGDRPRAGGGSLSSQDLLAMERRLTRKRRGRRQGRQVVFKNRKEGRGP